MTQLPRISDQVIAAYRAADYRVENSGKTFVLRIDQFSEPLAKLFAASGHRCAAFVTACNPRGERQCPQANAAANARLAERLTELVGDEGRVSGGAGCDPRGAWEEKSFLVLGLDLDTSCALGREFCQNAIVWAGADAIPRLVLLR